MRVKVCGLRSSVDVSVAVQAGVDAVGFVFAPSPRRIEVAEARSLLAAVPAGVLRVGVLRGPDSGPLQQMLDELELDAIQIEVDDPDRIPALPDPVRPWWVLKDSDDLLERAAVLPDGATVLIDSAVGGGSGRRADPGRVARLAALRPVMLAGGLTPDNVAGAIEQVRPCGVDVSSGVESAPGIKSPELVGAFVRRAREAAHRLPEGALPRCP